MELANIKEATEWFEVLQTGKRSQTAMMTLAPGQATGKKAEAHKNSDQVLLMLSGSFRARLAENECGWQRAMCSSYRPARLIASTIPGNGPQ